MANYDFGVPEGTKRYTYQPGFYDQPTEAQKRLRAKESFDRFMSNPNVQGRTDWGPYGSAVGLYTARNGDPYGIFGADAYKRASNDFQASLDALHWGQDRGIFSSTSSGGMFSDVIPGITQLVKGVAPVAIPALTGVLLGPALAGAGSASTGASGAGIGYGAGTGLTPVASSTGAGYGLGSLTAGGTGLGLQATAGQGLASLAAPTATAAGAGVASLAAPTTAGVTSIGGATGAGGGLSLSNLSDAVAAGLKNPKTLATLGGQAYGIYSQEQAKSAYEDLANQIQRGFNQSDPFSSFRPEALQMLKDLEANPDSYLQSPEVMAARNRAIQLIERQAAAQGKRLSGNLLQDLQDFSSQYDYQALQQRRNELAGWAGSNMYPNPAFQQASLQNLQNLNQARNQQVSNIGQIVDWSLQNLPKLGSGSNSNISFVGA